MEITITATPKEIAALFSEATKRQEEKFDFDNEKFLQTFEARFMQRFSNGLKNAVKRHHHPLSSSDIPEA